MDLNTHCCIPLCITNNTTERALWGQRGGGERERRRVHHPRLTTSTPRIYVAAMYPPKSPTTPPPKQITHVFRSHPCESIQSSTYVFHIAEWRERKEKEVGRVLCVHVCARVLFCTAQSLQKYSMEAHTPTTTSAFTSRDLLLSPGGIVFKMISHPNFSKLRVWVDEWVGGFMRRCVRMRACELGHTNAEG